MKQNRPSHRSPKRRVSWAISQWNNYAKEDHIPSLRLMGGGSTDAVVCIDNVVFHKSANQVTTVGAQTSAVTDGKFATRFVGAIDTRDFATVGFKVKATYTENGATVSKTFNKKDCTLYTEITANTTRGVEAYTAEELGGKYVFALTVYDIPADVTDLKFEVTPIFVNAKNEPWEGATADCYVSVDGTTVTLLDRPAA